MASKPFVIPSVDISPCLADSDSPASEAVIQQIREACKTSGFFQITGHGIPKDLRDSVLHASRTFFALPDSEKQRWKNVPGRGYESIGTEQIEPGTKQLKETFFIGRPDPSHRPPYRNFQHANIWPSASLPDSIFRHPLETYHAACLSLAQTLLTLLGRSLPYGTAAVFDEFCTAPLAAMALLHYPPNPHPGDPTVRGVGAHTDFGALTLLLQDGREAGLQVWDARGKEWVPVPPDGEAYVVNVGDMLERWTGGEYRSTVHRVISGQRDRYSVPFFLDGNLDFVLRPLTDGGDARPVTVEEHMNERFSMSYVDKESVERHRSMGKEPAAG